MSSILRIENLYVSYKIPLGHLRYGYRKIWAVKGVDMDVPHGIALGIVGGSGSGKSTILKAILGFVKPERGRILFRGFDIAKLKGRERRVISREISYVPQEPSQSINPKMRVYDVVAEPLKPLKLSVDEVEHRVYSVLEVLDLDPSIRNMFAKELSGGMLQRIAIARAIITRPSLVLLDEPTSNLDISIQAQILNMLIDLKQKLNLTYIFVSHDIDVVSYVANRIAVMASGRILEEGNVDKVLTEPLHPYTSMLLEPSKAPEEMKLLDDELCPIRSWCPWRQEICSKLYPPKTMIGDRYVYCWRYSKH
ncbi:ABC transporter ATP-binding protein [Ignisphaera sp. 4213-co]|uniref:ABC transporter ATP-binding protein n=1 Tax=Ignisphaera cupida TaxID=3050454 RepID=A0ABD4Z651_9CREN|nr:ABC transporter ATP-binding protein [Ignisphaera sp. 4213-co]MDK6028786.1 ABC transporter ATP-binding protein [Ignisphaera sp. 4213-co]